MYLVIPPDNLGKNLKKRTLIYLEKGLRIWSKMGLIMDLRTGSPTYTPKSLIVCLVVMYFNLLSPHTLRDRTVPRRLLGIPFSAHRTGWTLSGSVQCR